MHSSKKIVFLFLLVVFSIILFRTAWVGDDSYITMRSVDNFVNGYGLTWNPGERIQTYTHPLWMMLLVIIFSVTHHAYSSLIFLSMFLSISTFFFAFGREKDEFIIFIGFCMLVLSNAFIDYSTSGLENPASHFILVVFGIMYLNSFENMDKKRLLLLATLIGLSVLNRMDLSLLVLPPLLDRR